MVKMMIASPALWVALARKFSPLSIRATKAAPPGMENARVTSMPGPDTRCCLPPGCARPASSTGGAAGGDARRA